MSNNWPANAPPIGSGNNYEQDSNKGGHGGNAGYAGNQQPQQPQQPYQEQNYNSGIGSAGAQGPNQTNDPSIGSGGMIQGTPASGNFPYQNAPPIGSGGSYEPSHSNVGNAGEGEKHSKGGFF